MPTTTIRLSEELKVRVAEAAERAGMTSHNFMLEAIVEKTEQHARSAEFDALAERRYADILATGKTIPWSEMKAYLASRIAGVDVKPPIAKKFRP
ncbi:MAG TPA: CopG family transcriptional regulator [Telluria sp.]|jgi:predicted transcriptional regulator|nr:CopG family transcriptional regulator [Telluria sp.]